MHNVVIIMPSLNPDEKFINLINNINQHLLANIIVVDDGSNIESKHYFNKAKELGCKTLVHDVNLGKGRALKTAFDYILHNYPADVLSVCADSDGQHSVNDILSCIRALEQNPDCLIMGCRQFNDKTIPFRSRFGNIITRGVFKLLCGVNVSDTQTGLRAMSADLIQHFKNTKGNRFEFEMNMLIDAKEKGIRIQEVPISTIYIDENKTSHFNPLRDSLKIYAVFAKFLTSSLVSFLIDIGLFSLFIMVFKGIIDTSLSAILSTVFSRIISSLVNYTINKNTVFNVKYNKKSTLIKYYILCICQLLCSALAVAILCSIIKTHCVFIKLLVDLVLFVISFQIQREWVFKKQ